MKIPEQITERCHEKWNRMLLFEVNGYYEATENEVSFRNQWLTDDERANLWRELYKLMYGV